MENHESEDDNEEPVDEIVLPITDYRSYIATKSTQDVKTPICDVRIAVKVPAW
jgi:hypothetical protein